MLGHGRLRDPKLGLDDGRYGPRGQLAVGDELEDPASDRVTENVESVHAANNTSDDLYKSTLIADHVAAGLSIHARRIRLLSRAEAHGHEALATTMPVMLGVMALIAAGLSKEEIAERLVVSPATAKTHVSRVMGKLDARDRAQVVVLAYESGLVQPGHAPVPND